MADNAAIWKSRYADLTPGNAATNLPVAARPGIRIHVLKWDAQRKVADVISCMQRVTHDGLDLPALQIGGVQHGTSAIADMTAEQQTELEHLWRKRITDALTTKYFDTDAALLSRSLIKGDLTFYYFLVGRHNSDQMGHSDVVKILCVNSMQQVIAKVSKRYGSSYELGFVDQKGPVRDYLF